MHEEDDAQPDLPPDPFQGDGAVVGGPIDSPDVYAREDDDEALARTEEALERARLARDEAASQDIRDPRDHEQEFEDLGFMLAWWAEDNDVPIIDTVSDLANAICGSQQHLELVRKHGYPEDAMSTQVTLNQETGPLVVGALQILGSLHQHLRPAIRKLLVYIHDNLPVMTEEEQQAWLTAQRAAQQEQVEKMKAELEGRGATVIDLDDLGLDPDRDGGPEFDPGMS